MYRRVFNLAQKVSHIMDESIAQAGPEKILRDLWMAKAAQSLVAGVEPDVFMHIARGGRSLEEIARASRASLGGMRPLLDALTATGHLNGKSDWRGLEPAAAHTCDEVRTI